MGDEHVQALDPGRHPAGADPVDLGRRRPSSLAPRQVGLVRGLRYARGQLGVGAQPVGHLAHQSGRLERADRGRRPRAGQVVQRRERRAVGQPRRGLDRRPDCRTGSGARPPGSRAARGRAGRRPRPGRPDRRAVRSRRAAALRRCPTAGCSSAGCRRGLVPTSPTCARSRICWPVSTTMYDGVAGHRVLQPRAGLLLDVGRVATSALSASAVESEPAWSSAELLRGVLRRRCGCCR